MKREFIGKTFYRQFNETIVELRYKYRGMEYSVCENLNKGNEPLAWQHKSEQARIDRILDAPKSNATENAQVGFDKFWDFVEGKDVDWD